MFDLSYLDSRGFFDNSRSQIYLILQPVSNTQRMQTGDTETIKAQKFKGLSVENTKYLITPGNILDPRLKQIHKQKQH